MLGKSLALSPEEVESEEKGGCGEEEG